MDSDLKNIPMKKFVQLVDCHQDTVRAAIREGDITPARDERGQLKFDRRDVGVMRERVLRKVVR